MVVEVRFVPPGPSAEEKKKQTKKKSKGKSSHWFLEIQRGIIITLSFLNEIMCFKRLFVCLNTSIICGGGLLIHRYILNS